MFDVGKLAKVLEEAREVALITHRSPDLDSYTSAILFLDYLKSMGKRPCLLSGKPSREVSGVLGRLGISVEESPCIACDLSLIFDVANRSQLSSEPCGKFTVIFDHHESRSLKGDVEFVDHKAASTVEIVITVLRSLGYRPSKPLGEMALAAIVAETGRFTRASGLTFDAVSWLINNVGVNYNESLRLIERRIEDVDVSERVAILKGLMRVVAYRSGQLILCITTVNSYESTVAERLVESGCSMAFVISSHEDEIRVVARSRGVNIAGVMRRIAEELGGEGGGHSGAGMAVTKVKHTQYRVMRTIIDVIKEAMGSEFSEVK